MKFNPFSENPDEPAIWMNFPEFGKANYPETPVSSVAERSQFPENDELEALTRYCTEEEDAAKEMERQAKKSATILREKRIGEQFDAIVTGTSDGGTWVFLLHPSIAGRPRNGFSDLDVGHRLRVQLVRRDMERGSTDFKKVV